MISRAPVPLSPPPILSSPPQQHHTVPTGVAVSSLTQQHTSASTPGLVHQIYTPSPGVSSHSQPRKTIASHTSQGNVPEMEDSKSNMNSEPFVISVVSDEAVAAANNDEEVNNEEGKNEVKDQKRRLMTMKEIIETEIEYNRDLKTLESIQTKMTQQKLLPQDIMAQIFSNINGLSKVNELIQTKIEEAKSKIGNTEEDLFKIPLGQIYLSLAPFLKMYLQYCENHDNALIVLTKHKKKNKQLDNWLNQEAEKCKGLYLKDYLIKPVQRLCKYPLLIQNLLSLTPENDPDYPDLVLCLNRINDIVMDINEIRGKNVNFATLSMYEESLQDYDGTLLSQQRTFIREGTMFVQEDKKSRIPQMKKSDSQERVLLIFNDKLLFCKKNSSFGSKNHTLKFLYELETDSVIVSATYAAHPEHDISFLLEKKTDDKRAWMIFFENTPEKTTWYKVFQETINTEKKRKIQKEDDIIIPTELFSLDPNLIKEKELRILLTLFLSPSGIPIKNKKVKLKTYKNCFSGKDMVNWLTEKNIAEDRPKGTLMGQKFIDLKYMKHAIEENGAFKDDSSSLYRFDSISMDRDQSRASRSRSHGPESKFIKSVGHLPRISSDVPELPPSVPTSSVQDPEQQTAINC